MPALLLVLQLFTETTAPAEGKCVAVKFENTTYRALKVERTRLTGTVTLTMPGGWEPVGTPPPTTPAQAAAAQAERQRVATCVEQKNSDLMKAIAARAAWESCKRDYFMRNCGPEPPKENAYFADILFKAECSTGTVDPEIAAILRGPPMRRKAGREIQLKSYDSIANDSSCECAGGNCVNR